LALTWSWYLLAQRPEVEAKLAAELQTVLDGRTPHAADFPKLRYTEMVIKETLRLYPPVWLLGPRLAFHAYDLGGYRLPAGSMLMISPWVTHRDPRYFEHPEVFDPDRWADGRARQMPKYAYFPFSGGQRHCVGHYYAMMEAVLVLATIAQSFRLQRTSGAPITPQPLVTLQPREGMPMLLTRR